MRAALALGLLLCGCPRQEEAPPFDPDDRLLQKLKAEQERLAKVGPPKPKAPEPNPLAAVVGRTDRPETLGIPAGVAADLGPLGLALVEVQQSQQVSGGRVVLSTTDRFLRVALDAEARAPISLDLSTATLERAGRALSLARDAQRAGRGSPLEVSFQRGDKRPLVLFFEAPPEMIGKGLKIVLTSGGSRVELPLQ